MDHRAILLDKEDGKVLRILHGINPSDYKGRKDVLIDPAIPRGIPPHEWIIKNGQIQGTVPTLPSKKPNLIGYYALGVVSGIIVTVIFVYIKAHL